METFSKVTISGSSAGNPDWFKVEAKNGITYEYGNTADSKFKIEDGTATISWQINKMYDQYGNYLTYTYEMNGRELRVKEINYTGNTAADITPYNKIAFSYANRDDSNKFYTGGAIVEQKSLLTSIVISTESNQTVKTYGFNYAMDYSYSYLREVTESGSDGTTLNSTIFKYGNETLLSTNLTEEEIETGVYLEGSTDFFTGDINGDGYTDIVQAPYTIENGIKFHAKFKVYLRNKSTNTFYLSYVENLPEKTYIGMSDSKGNKSFALTDFNGDGRDDIGIFIIKTNPVVANVNLNIKIYYSNNTGTAFNKTDAFDGTAGYIYIDPNSSVHTPRNLYTIGDFDGDGRSDILLSINEYNTSFGYFSPQLELIRPYLGHFEGYVSTLDLTSAEMLQIVNAERLMPIDFDGDGKMEILVKRTPFYDIIRFSPRISPNGDKYIAAEKLLSSGPVTVYPNKIFMGDFNGDRKGDFLTLASNNSWYIYYSNGVNQFDIKPFSFNLMPKDIVIADFDGDGLSDICNSVGNDFCCGLSYPKFDIYYNKGVNRTPYNVSYTSPNIWGSDPPCIVGDFNGDGKPDLFLTAWRIFYLSPNVNGKYRLLNKVKNGFGLTTQIEYKSLLEGGDFYNKNVASSYPINVLNAPIYVASSVTVPDGIGGTIATTYKYENAKVHRGGLGFMGFSKFQSDNVVHDVRSISEFEVVTSSTTPQYITTALKKQTTKRISNDALLSETTNINSFKISGSRYWIKIDATSSKNWLTAATSNSTYTYDDYGNVTQEVTNINNIETITSTKTFGSAYGTPVPAHPVVVGVQKTRSGNGFVSESSNFGYNSKGDMTSRTDISSEAGSSVQTKSIGYVYNPTIGFLSAKSTYSNGIAPRYENFGCDEKGRFVTSSTNPLGQTASKTYDPKWGAVLTETDITGKTTVYTYDGFGRIIQAVDPQDNNVGLQYLWSYDAQYLPTKCYDIVKTIPGSPSTWDIYDAFDRKVIATNESYGDKDHRGVYTYAVT